LLCFGLCCVWGGFGGVGWGVWGGGGWFWGGVLGVWGLGWVGVVCGCVWVLGGLVSVPFLELVGCRGSIVCGGSPASSGE
ncbi:hypothetical protein, partial [Pseudomonas syringae group genomosp. 7]|uniref:hypothetical protein n=1 Tax=Pseudomonas syringae group genomosp. 7 TaxID=251699 RepID=UPI0037703BFE